MSEGKERIFFGSLELKEKERLEKGESLASASGSTSESVVLPFSAKTLESQEKQLQILQKLEQTKKARTIAVPTNDDSVKLRLRELGEPIILFGEKPEDRRDRLRELLARFNLTDGMPSSSRVVEKPKKSQAAQAKEDENEAYLTEGTQELLSARLWTAKYSIERARDRIAGAKRKRELAAAETNTTESTTTETTHSDGMDIDQKPTTEVTAEKFSNFANTSSQIGAERPLSAVAFSPDCASLSTGSWAGVIKIWDVKTCENVMNLRGHSERINYITYHPQATLMQTPTTVNMASASADRTVKLWSVPQAEPGNVANVSPIASLEGHEDRVNRLAFHPSGRFLFSTSSDKTWKMWDVETKTAVFTQEGHSRPVFGVAAQCDGSVVATGGQDAIVRLWDLRSGKSIYVFNGHVKQVVTIDFSPNGYVFASGSEDHSVRIWDLRKRKNVYILAGHSSLVSSVKYERDGNFLLTGSFDKTAAIWSTKTWAPLKTFTGHEGQVMGADITQDSQSIATISHDRTWKLWKQEK